MRFIGNGPEVARFAGPFGRAFGFGLGGELRVGGQVVVCGDWVIRDDVAVAVVPQALFAAGKYVEVPDADQQ
uniref:Uncharacterized protein n=1 Tax=Bosea sp. NBC_00436 TaxID=2969620 RepID=A0A9E8CMF4_9HYPH